MSRELERIPIRAFNQDPHAVARLLLGSILIRQTEEGVCTGRIIEVEAYGGVDDASSHADKGNVTKKNASMFMTPGTVYVYPIHRWYCLNVVTKAAKKPSAVLIRAVEPLEGLDLMATRRGITLETRKNVRKLASGPGKICQAFGITRQDDGLSCDEDNLFIEQGRLAQNEQIVTSSRVGLNPKTCGESASWHWRYRIS